jgi:hypothetical protein
VRPLDRGARLQSGHAIGNINKGEIAMKTTTTKYTTPLYVKDGSPEADFVQRFEGCMTSVWVFLDDNGFFFEHPQLKADWQEMEQYWD